MHDEVWHDHVALMETFHTVPATIRKLVLRAFDYAHSYSDSGLHGIPWSRGVNHLRAAWVVAVQERGTK